MLVQSLKHAFKTGPKVPPPVTSLWLARNAIALTATILARSAIRRTADPKPWCPRYGSRQARSPRLLARSTIRRTADGAQPRMLAPLLKHPFKTRPKVRPPVPPLWLARNAIALTATLLPQSDRTADGAKCWHNHQNTKTHRKPVPPLWLA